MEFHWYHIGIRVLTGEYVNWATRDVKDDNASGKRASILYNQGPFESVQEQLLAL
jgi:hypothetical protein